MYVQFLFISINEALEVILSSLKSYSINFIIKIYFFQVKLIEKLIDF